MKRLPIITTAFLLAGMCIAGHTVEPTTVKAADADSSANEVPWEDPELPPFIANYMNPEVWTVYTICKAGRHAYYFAEDSCTV